jgi:predicted ATPase/transcriptional regulator with XRE-family HTH domain
MDDRMTARAGTRAMMTGAPSDFGNVLRRVRIAAGLTQEALAERAGLSVRGISDLERGVNRTPRKDTVALLLETLQPTGDDRAAFDAAAGGRGPRSARVRPQVSLPAPLTSLIGRAADVAAVSDLIGRRDVRLVTLTGTGGVGKTRLAIQIASDLRDDFPDGVWFVGLSSIYDPGLVAPSIAQAFDLPDAGDRAYRDRLIAYLGPKRLLLVLDNFEHLLPAATLVADLLGACPSLAVLVTSRAPLRVSGEHGRLVQPLAVPDLRHLPESDELARYPAVGLFLERAQAVSPEFQLTPANAAAVAMICSHLDGLPLALELAAARVKLLPPVAMVDRLQQRLQVLTIGARDSPARQRTLRDAIAWSYDLLESPEQRLFRCLAVFTGGWTLEAAEAVCGQLSTPDPVLDGLAALVDNNLVRAIEEQSGTPRFTMLETVGEYAREQLAGSGDEREYRLRHVRVFLEIAQQLDIKLRSSERMAWRDRLAAEVDNLRTAVNWAIERGEAELALGLTAALYWPWLQLGRFRELRQWSEAALALPSGMSHSAARARTMLTAGAFAWLNGDTVEMHQRLTEGAELCAEIGDRQGLGLAAQCLGLLALSQGDYAVAGAQLVESVAHFRQIEDEWHLANALFILGDAVVKNDPIEARALYEESLARFRQLGDPWGIALPLTGLGGIALQRGEYAAARALFSEGLALRQDLHDRWGAAISQTSLGEVARREGDFTGAATLLAEGLEVFREVGDQERVAWALHALGCVAEDQADPDRAGAYFAESLVLRQDQAHRPGMTASLAGLARVAASTGSPERAARLLAAADALREAGGVTVPPDERVAGERLLESARADLGEAAFAAAWDAGRARPIDLIVAEAVGRVGAYS